jgi:hydroxyacyl-ACP dehydratase HTD2-like protein with hotdog domain
MTMTTLLSPELLAQIGSRSGPQTELVTRKDIRKYSIATEQRLRQYLDGDVAPPMFHLALFWPVRPIDQLSPDGVTADEMFPQLPLKRAMAGGLSVEYHRPIKPGDVLSSMRTLTNIYEKQGSSGPLIFVEVTMEVVDAKGELVLTEEATRILR